MVRDVVGRALHVDVEAAGMEGVLDRFLDGDLDEVTAYRHALAPAEIGGIAEAARARRYVK